MRKLGDHFPPEDKRAWIKQQLQAGSVFYLSCEFTHPPKDKYIVLVCPVATLPRPLLFVINSDIHPLLYRNPHTRSCQLQLNAADYDFLDHDSYVDCTNVIDSINEDAIIDQLATNVGRLKGTPNANSMSEMAEIVQRAKTIIPRHKLAIGEALTA